MIKARKDIIDLARELVIPEFIEHFGDMEHVPKERLRHVDESFFTSLSDLLSLFHQQQTQGKRGPLQFITIAILYSSIVTKTYALKLSAYDKNWRLVQDPTSVAWVPSEYVAHLEEDIQKVGQAARRQLIQVSNLDLDIFRMDYSIFYYSSIAAYLATLSQAMCDTLASTNVELDTGVEILFGEHMGQQVSLSKYSE